MTTFSNKLTVDATHRKRLSRLKFDKENNMSIIAGKVVPAVEVEASVCVLQAEQSGNVNDWVMAGVAYLRTDNIEMHKYCQRMADALRRRKKLSRRNVTEHAVTLSV